LTDNLNQNQEKLPVAQGTDTSVVERRIKAEVAGSIPAIGLRFGVACRVRFSPAAFILDIRKKGGAPCA